MVNKRLVGLKKHVPPCRTVRFRRKCHFIMWFSLIGVRLCDQVLLTGPGDHWGLWKNIEGNRVGRGDTISFSISSCHGLTECLLHVGIKARFFYSIINKLCFEGFLVGLDFLWFFGFLGFFMLHWFFRSRYRSALCPCSQILVLVTWMMKNGFALGFPHMMDKLVHCHFHFSWTLEHRHTFKAHCISFLSCSDSEGFFNGWFSLNFINF